MAYLIPFEPSNSEYITVSMPLGTSGIPDYGKIDFQIQAQTGYIQAERSAFAARVWGIHYNFTGQSSDWSNIRTIAISDG